MAQGVPLLPNEPRGVLAALPQAFQRRIGLWSSQKEVRRNPQVQESRSPKERVAMQADCLQHYRIDSRNARTRNPAGFQ